MVTRMVVVMVMAGWALAYAGETDRDWWGELRRAAVGCHDGWDVRVDLTGGIGARTLGDTARSGPFGEARITVPLYSRVERQKRMLERGRFLEHGAQLIQELEQAKAKIVVKQEQALVLRAALLQEGLTGINAYFAIREEVAVLIASAAAAELKLTGYVESCGK